jgi:acyl transferase domain-containing protein
MSESIEVMFHEETNKMPRATDDSSRCLQEPIAVIGMACRLPGHNTTPSKLWEFLKSGQHAPNTIPSSRFNLTGHYNGSRNLTSMVSPGGMFLENVDLQEFDSQFFRLSKQETICMDPQQRQILEVVYEGLENAGLTLENLDGRSFGCFVGSYACGEYQPLIRGCY